MAAIVEAVYKNGVFRPAAQPALAEGARVTLIVESVAAREPDDIPRLAAQVCAGMSPQDVADVERSAQRRPLWTWRQTSSPGGIRAKTNGSRPPIEER